MSTQCVCRVPIEEASVPAFTTTAEAFQWLAEQARLAKLSAQRQQVYEEALYAAAARGIGSARAMQAAREALSRAEANLDSSTKAQLGPVWTDDGRLGHALMVGLQRMNEDDNARNAIQAAGL